MWEGLSWARLAQGLARSQLALGLEQLVLEVGSCCYHHWSPALPPFVSWLPLT